MRTGAHLVVEALLGAGVRHVFSLSGNQILSIYDATIGRGPTIIHTRHEAAAVHMADAWGRLTGTPGVALVTAAPGHCNAVSALYGALMAESPVVLLSGHSPLAQSGRGAFQELDQAAVVAPVTKAAWVARSAASLGDDMARALALAQAGRPGPVHVSLPGDLLESHVEAARVVPAMATPAAAAAPLPRTAASVGAPIPAGIPDGVADGAVRMILDALAEAVRPLVLVGPAMARGDRWAAVRRLTEATGVPALPVESPRGPNDPWLHMAATLLPEADLVLLLGKRLDFAVRFGETPPFGKECRFIQVDVEAAALQEGGRVTLALHAEPEAVASRLADAAAGRAWPHHVWGRQVAEARRAEPPGWEALRAASRSPLHPLRVCAAVQPYLDRGGILVADGGEFGQWAQAGLEAETRLINGLSGSIGSALPMAIAARLACPDRTVFALLGDGTFGFHAFELDTAARAALPVVAVVGNDARWNAEHQLQIQHYGAARAFACELAPSRYELMAAALGGHGERVERAEDLEPALARAVASGRPACVNVLIEGAAAPTYRAGPAAH